MTRDNPLCGDRVTLDLELDQDRVSAVAHKTRGCLLTEAAAALLAADAASLSPDALREALPRLRRWLDEGGSPPWPSSPSSSRCAVYAVATSACCCPSKR